MDSECSSSLPFLAMTTLELMVVLTIKTGSLASFHWWSKHFVMK